MQLFDNVPKRWRKRNHSKGISFWKRLKERVSDITGDDDKLHLFSLTQHNFSQNCYHQVCYMFQRALRLPSGMPIQNTYKGRYSNDIIVHSVKLIWPCWNIWNTNPSVLRSNSSNNTLFGKFVTEMTLTIFLLTSFLPIHTYIYFEKF